MPTPPNQKDNPQNPLAGRNTKQKQAIREAFEESGRPLSPQEILELGQKSSANLSLPTVYRALKAMVTANEIITVDLPGQPARYELEGLHHHHHFLCETCGRLFDIPGCPAAVHALAPKGFHVERHELTLIGQCPDCRKIKSWSIPPR